MKAPNKREVGKASLWVTVGVVLDWLFANKDTIFSVLGLR